MEPVACDLPEGPVVIFSGSFRPWHGADVLVRAAKHVLEGRFGSRAVFLLIGGGPALEPARHLARELSVEHRVRFVGPVDYDAMPGYLALGDIGVAPYQPSRLGPMKLGFFWSPLKIFEYMATGIPTITLDVEPLKQIVRPDQEGLVVEEGEPEALARAIESLLAEPERARAMGRSSRERVESRFSWKRHCEQLETLLRDIQPGAEAP